jgi:hypothetical protein
MISSLRALSVLSLSAFLMPAFAGCGSAEGNDESNASTGSEAIALHSKGKGGASGSAGSTGAGGTPTDPAAIIAAAQTPDGTAIPQGPGPNGQCAAVVALLGFWSCVRQGDVCTYKTGAVTHHCSCVRVDGEGGYPAWTCD